jgi:hypothetical protein
MYEYFSTSYLYPNKTKANIAFQIGLLHYKSRNIILPHESVGGNNNKYNSSKCTYLLK